MIKLLQLLLEDRLDAMKDRLKLRKICQNNGFIINERKTRIQSHVSGRRVISGISVDKFNLYPTRKTRKKIRAAAHQNNASSLRGLTEWSKCKLPK